ncbi:hypothetical protein DI53_2057 [Sphingobacterium deserti]|uniref:Uncharacterized protein n=1 Tax=Sphingobacterium deserti TaxID=1229276 RepID=A0A0B8T0N9_9SPHI|nr:hypothetical protein DI53_2057 [Sphingobacterium deserti]
MATKKLIIKRKIQRKKTHDYAYFFYFYSVINISNNDSYATV